MKIINIKQGTDEWKLAKLGMVSASNFDAVMSKGKGNDEAIGRRNYRLRLALERITGELSDDGFQSAAMAFGIEQEKFARAAFEAYTGKVVYEVGLGVMDGDEVCASPDGLIDTDEGIEVKSVSPGVHLGYMNLTTDAPAEYRPQVHGNMWVFNRKLWHFVSYCPKMPKPLRLHIVQVERDDDYIDVIKKSTATFLKDVRDTESDLRGRMAIAIKNGAKDMDEIDDDLGDAFKQIPVDSANGPVDDGLELRDAVQQPAAAIASAPQTEAQNKEENWF